MFVNNGKYPHVLSWAVASAPSERSSRVSARAPAAQSAPRAPQSAHRAHGGGRQAMRGNPL